VPPHVLHKRFGLRQRLLAMVDTIANLSAVDGCVVFDRKLKLSQFGAMIELSSKHDDVLCLMGGSSEPVSPEVIRRSFGARRKSALDLCRACPGAMAFVVSQDGDLRIFVRDGDVVRFFDRAAYW
jgi:DNA integrity scanning protein DisA with diadenylate cyclase activity